MEEPMRTFAKPLLVAFLTAVLAVVGTVPVVAAPTNDNYADRQTLTFGSSVSVDTSTATTEALDSEATSACPVPPGPPPRTENTIWYEFTADSSTPAPAAVIVEQAFWAAGVAIVTGDPGSFKGVACGPTLAVFSPVAGTTYRILVFDFAGSGGGTATVKLGSVPPPPEIGLTVDPTGTFNARTGGATITGTYRCTNAFFIAIFGNIQQAVGRFKIQGSYNTFDIQCDGAVHPWSAEVFASNGKFAGGKAATVTIGFSCGALFCSQAFVEQTILLKGR
jgi:hypothetical protein